MSLTENLQFSDNQSYSSCKIEGSSFFSFRLHESNVKKQSYDFLNSYKHFLFSKKTEQRGNYPQLILGRQGLFHTEQSEGLRFWLLILTSSALY